MLLAGSIIRGASRSDTRFVDFDESNMDVIVFPSKKWPRMGVILGNEALVLDYKTMMAFRVRSGNLGFTTDVAILKAKSRFDKAFLNKYFRENQDNPYGVQNVMNMVYRQADVCMATQFPPLLVPKLAGQARRRAIDEMIALAKKGDMVFSFRRHHRISAAIRKYDRSQFSHVAMYLGSGEVADIGPGGGKVNSLHDADDETHFALYTLKGDIPFETRENIAMKMRSSIVGARFSHHKIFLMYLRKRFGIPVMKGVPSVADLLYANAFDLVNYF